MATLVDVVCCRWKIEEDFQAGKSACGLDEGQTTCWNSWMRWSLISMLAAAVLAVTQARATTQTPGGPLAPSSAQGLCKVAGWVRLPGDGLSCRVGPGCRCRHGLVDHVSVEFT
jgi:hypothetical protein